MKNNKNIRSILAFAVTGLLLLLVFFIAVNTGSLSVSFGQLLKGLFVEYDADVAAVYDLRFPRIFISMLAGAAIAVSGVLFQAVLKNPLADPGIIGLKDGQVGMEGPPGRIITTQSIRQLYGVELSVVSVGGEKFVLTV